jgi:hypothetical protein
VFLRWSCWRKVQILLIFCGGLNKLYLDIAGKERCVSLDLIQANGDLCFCVGAVGEKFKFSSDFAVAKACFLHFF